MIFIGSSGGPTLKVQDIQRFLNEINYKSVMQEKQHSELFLYRKLLLTGAVLYLLFGLLFKSVEPRYVDPMSMKDRIAFSLIFLITYIFSFKDIFIKNNYLNYIFFGLINIATIYCVYLSYINQFRLDVAIGIPLIIIVVNLILKDFKQLLYYNLVTLFSIIVSVYSIDIDFIFKNLYLVLIILVIIMFFTISRSKHKLELRLIESENRLRTITDQMLDMVCQTNEKGIFHYVSPSYESVLGYKPAYLYGKSMLDFVHPKDLLRVKSQHRNYLKTSEVKKIELRYRHADGYYLWLAVIANPILDNQGKIIGTVISSQDITTKKLQENELKLLRFKDSLTGLYNRNYFEENLDKINNSGQLPLSIIIADCNNLKKINDTFGHQQGDKLLKKVAEVLKQSCRKEDIICRLGGDEFLLFLPETTKEQASTICVSIKKNYENQDINNIPLGISLGVATKESVNQEIGEVLNLADINMYSDKLRKKKLLSQNS